jgi:ribonuclease VapC
VIVVDTSALMAIVLDEAEAAFCMAAIERDAEPLISAGTVAEVLIVAGRRGVGREIARLVAGLGMEIIAVSEADARRVAAAYGKWGRGAHRAALNFGDCFAYALAKEHRCPLLFVGEDFTRTDVKRAAR